jgi:hypothetical protein
MTVNIDLTEHHDFGGVEEGDTLFSAWLDTEIMTADQYETVVKWERVFGRRHRNEKDKIFDKDFPFIEISVDKCHRCGCDLRAPWKRVYGLCIRCNDIVEHNVQQIPWKTYTPHIRRVGDRGQGDLFDLR